MIPQIFNYEETELTVMTDDDGNQWFIASEVCEILEIVNVPQAVANVEKADKGIYSIYTLGGQQKVNIINEYGLFDIILNSRKPKARKFKHWLSHEVLPELRKEGQYQLKPAKPPTQIEVLEQLLSSLKQVEQLENNQIQLIAEKEKLQPNADFAVSALLPGMDINVSNFAKVNGMHPNLLKKWFRQQKIYMTAKGVKDKKYNTPFQIWMGYFNCIEETYENRKTGEKDHRILPLIKFEMQAKLLAKINKHAPEWVYKTKPKELSK